MKNLDVYFEKCIKDAYESENREFNSDKVEWFYIVVGNQILFSIYTPYARVSRKAEYRIQKNIEKNFGFTIDGDYFLDTILQPNFVCNHFMVGKTSYFLCKKVDYDNMERGEVILSGRYEKLLKSYFNINNEELAEDIDNNNRKYYLPHDMNWNDYRETYKKAFGEYPEVEIQEISKTLILE